MSFIKNIPEEYIVKDIIISKDLSWNNRGVQTSPEKILRDVDLVINSIHGNFGGGWSYKEFLIIFQYHIPAHRHCHHS